MKIQLIYLKINSQLKRNMQKSDIESEDPYRCINDGLQDVSVKS